jgi:hypothetical protein
MPDSIREKIIKNMVITLEGITEANGYDITVQRVLRLPTSPFDFQQFPFIMVVYAGDDVQEGVPHNLTTVLMHLELICWNSEWLDISEKSIQIIAAIEKALNVDQTRGGSAYDTDIISNALLLSDEAMPYGGCVVRVDIFYRNALGNPYSLT